MKIENKKENGYITYSLMRYNNDNGQDEAFASITIKENLTVVPRVTLAISDLLKLLSRS